MKQRKHKPGNPGTRFAKGPQSPDRKGKFAQAANTGKAAGKGRRDHRESRPDEVSHKARPGGREDRPQRDRIVAPATSRRRSDEDYGPERRNPEGGSGAYWLFGHHAVAAALANPRRRFQRLVHLSGEVQPETSLAPAGAQLLPPWEPIDRAGLERLLPEGAVHQGVAARVSPLPESDLYEICDLAAERDQAHVLILDQVTDPHNVGAILRSAAAFGALAVILTERHAAPESGTLAKAASGALEVVPLVRVGNLARAMEQLKEAGFWLAGLAAEGRSDLAAAKLSGKVGLVLGAEGPGLRRLTRDHCDLLVRLPTSGPISHLNVSNAAAVALYELVRAQPERPTIAASE